MQARPIQVQVLFFASLQESAGARQVAVAVAEGSTVAQLSEMLGRERPQLRERLALARVAVNLAVVSAACTLRDGDKIAYLPAVSGG